VTRSGWTAGAHRLSALRRGDLCLRDRASGTGRARHAPRSGRLSPAFVPVRVQPL